MLLSNFGTKTADSVRSRSSTGVLAPTTVEKILGAFFFGAETNSAHYFLQHPIFTSNRIYLESTFGNPINR